MVLSLPMMAREGGGKSVVRTFDKAKNKFKGGGLKVQLLQQNRKFQRVLIDL
jgi:hypothetical protein